MHLAQNALPDIDAPFSWHRSDGVVWISFNSAGAGGAFSTRHGGVSSGRYASLNLGDGTDDNLELVRVNKTRFRSAIKRNNHELSTVKQIHGKDIVNAQTSSSEANDSDFSKHTKADGLITNEGSHTLLVLTADCFPVALVTDESVAIIHCGWRGISAGIVKGGLKKSSQVSGRRVEEVVAFIGPGIGRCCYKVGEEVVSAISKLRPGADVSWERALDLGEVVRRELIDAGVLQRNIHSVDLCTSCNDGLFFSHRRDGATGRQGGSVWLA